MTAVKKAEKEALASEGLKSRHAQLILEELGYWLQLYRIPVKQALDYLRSGYALRAIRELEESGQKASQTKIYALSNITPEKYRQIRDTKHEPKETGDTTFNYLIHHWRFTPPYGNRGKAKPLRIKSKEGFPDFRRLCKESVPGHGYSFVLKQLIEYGAVEVSDGIAQLNSQRILSNKADFQQYVDNARSIRSLLRTINHNITHKNNPTGYQPEDLLPQRYQMTASSLEDKQALKKRLIQIIEEALEKTTAAMNAHELDKHSAEDPRLLVGFHLDIEPHF